MSDRVEQRLAELEARIAFQEHALSEMSDALAAARMENYRYSEQLARALEELKSMRGMVLADPASEPPPPHY